MNSASTSTERRDIDLLVRGGLCLVGDRWRPADLAVACGRITAVAPPGSLTGAHRLLVADGLAVLPGAIDPHVHFDEPGHGDWEGWATGSLAALAGGVTTVLEMPIDADPPTTTAARLREKRELAEAASLVDFGLFGGLVDGDRQRLDALARAGAVGLKAFLCDSGNPSFPPVEDAELLVGCEVGAAHGLRVAVHCESGALLERDRRRAIARPIAAEVDGVRRLRRAIRATGAHGHVVHLSSAQALSVISPRDRDRLSVETCAHYLLLDEEAASEIGPQAWCAPPLRSSAERARLFAALLIGRIDALASDHSPCPAALKCGPRPFLGVSGVETTLPALWASGRLSLARISALRVAAARLFGLTRKGRLAPGYDADLVLFDAGSEWKASADRLHSRQRSTPFVGRTMRGLVRSAVVRGRVVFDECQQADEPAGRFLRPAPLARR